MDANVGDRVQTCDGHTGTVTKKYHVTGRGLYVHIKEADGRIWYCPASCIIRKDVTVNEGTTESELVEALRRNTACVGHVLAKERMWHSDD